MSATLTISGLDHFELFLVPLSLTDSLTTDSVTQWAYLNFWYITRVIGYWHQAGGYDLFLIFASFLLLCLPVVLVSNVGLFVVVACPVSASVVNPVLENIHTLFLLSMAISLFVLFTLCLSSHQACCGLGFRADQVALVQWDGCVHLRQEQSWRRVKHMLRRL